MNWQWLLDGAVGCATGIISGFGIGGGSLLVLYLTAVSGVPQSAAGGMNLIYFLFCAPAALWSHIREKRVDWQAVLWCSAVGVPAAIGAAMLVPLIELSWLRRAFGVVLLYIGFRELFLKKDSASTKK